MIMSPGYMAFAREWAESAEFDPLELVRVIGDTSVKEASDDDMVWLINATYEGGWRQLKRDADA